MLIPGSRGAFSYLVLPTPSEHPSTSRSGSSLAHGAGRRLTRSAARVGGKAHYPDSNKLLITELDSRVVCDDKALLYEERPEAYKDAACVVADQDAGKTHLQVNTQIFGLQLSTIRVTRSNIQ